MNTANPPIDPYAGINALYQEIENEPDVLEKIDKIPFVETPLHRAATDGDIRLATEIIRMKPSFAWKLNPQGLSPIHLAVHNGRIGIVRRFVSINKDLVRVKGKKGLTPLHLAAENGQIDVLAEFLIASPDSIEDLTVEGETALHIAGNNRQFETLAVLIDWLRLSSYPLRKSILNQKNESGETILHVSTRNRNRQTVKLLIENGIKLDAKNSMGSTAMDIAEMRDFENAEIKNMLVNAKAKQRLTSKLTIAEIVDDFRRKISSLKIDDTTRNAFMAVAVLIATMIYQSALSPPGGVYQSDASAASTNRTSSNSTFLVGKSVMSTGEFSFFLNVNTVSLLVSTLVIIVVIPVGWARFPIIMALTYFWFSYIYSMFIISPIGYIQLASIFSTVAAVLFIFFIWFQVWKAMDISKLERLRENREPEAGGNRW